MSFWQRYVSVAERRAKAQRKIATLRKKGKSIQPVEVDGRIIARSFWGKGWCDHLESFSDYENRLPRGRTYVRNGSVCHLEIHPGRIEALVAGSSLYTVSIAIQKLKPRLWKAIKQKCSGQIGSMLELLQGRLSDKVMELVTHREDGLFPKPEEITLSCSCPDWAIMCKHVASVLYGVGSRLDTQPELLFRLRDVDAQELIATDMTLPSGADDTSDALDDEQLSGIFGIELDADAPAEVEPVPPAPAKRKPARKAAAKPASKKKRAKQKGRKRTPQKTGRSGKEARKNAKKTTQRPAKPRRVHAGDTTTQAKQTGAKLTARTIAQLRKQLGYSVSQFAEAAGVTSASVYRWESARGPLKLQARPLEAIKQLLREAEKK